jgi:purine-binding chemotaxis protein CheW
VTGGDPAGAADAAACRWILFRAGGERYALPLEAVREVVLPQPPFARVPRSGPAVRGAMNLRGRVVPVVDVAALLGRAGPRLAPGDGQVIVLEGTQPGLGLLVAGVLGVEQLAPAADPAGAAAGEGIAAAGGAPVTLLDAAALASAAESHFGAPERRAVP